MPDHLHMLISIPPKHAVSAVFGFIKGKSGIHLARVYGERRPTRRPELLGEGAFCVDGRPGRSDDPGIHPHPRGRGQATRSAQPLGLIGHR